MSRVRRLPGLLVGALAVLIAWLERRDPARPGGDRSRREAEAPTTGRATTQAAPAPASAAATGAAVPEGAIPGDGTTDCPDSHPIKGNANSMIYHEAGGASYARTIPNFCFATAEAAAAAGYRPSQH